MRAYDHAPVQAPPPRHESGVYRVGLVCLGNICRSPMAEVVLRAEVEHAGLSGQVEVDSAGTGDWHVGGPMDPRARAELARHGYDGAQHRARQFEPSWYGRYDLVVAMDESNLKRLRRMAPGPQDMDRTVLFRSFDPAVAGQRNARDLEVPDPYDGGPEDYALVFDLVQPAARGLVQQLKELLADRPESSG
jgi:protein-tyrosine phosphatase